MPHQIGKKLSHGVAAWLQFEYQCYRSELFSEKYLSFPIGQILTSYYGVSVRAEVRHPILAANVKGKGRRPEVDFAVQHQATYPEWQVAIESKWRGQTALSTTGIIWDLVRLGVIKQLYPNALCFFLLGGRRRHLDALFRRPGFRNTGKKGTHRRLLKTGPTESAVLRFDGPTEYQLPLFKKVLEDFPALVIPAKLRSTLRDVYPTTCNNKAFQIYVWEIRTGDKTLNVGNSLYYKK